MTMTRNIIGQSVRERGISESKDRKGKSNAPGVTFHGVTSTDPAEVKIKHFSRDDI
jgi:hypothetical protein